MGATAAEMAAAETAETACGAESAGGSGPGTEGHAAGGCSTHAVGGVVVGVFFVVAGDEEQEEDNDDNADQQADEAGNGFVFFVLAVTVFAGDDGFDYIEGVDKGLIVVAVGERGNHFVVDDAFAECVGECAFEAVAGRDGDVAIILVGGMGFDEDDQAVGEFVLTDTPGFADALGDSHDFVAMEGGGDDDGDLVGGGVGEGDQALFERGLLLGGEEGGVIVHQTGGTRRGPLRKEG